ncbi:vacuolar protein sorting-associated protein 33A [Colletotrichum spaethianum]|uniref:Vacuolar protein sorting-associated protein 33A n=1 Tax=Colletotrichum spaethianum TaxID=700344 RepID=A0AA37LDQ8_9PEZI|nr:vacuolar protein sorting-associated protein 33A [Colletotrichum spaethianum]GKT42357.1 vacuolar protein sorting-associated protein 33A [Colletotrichum spaethianum]
MAPRAGFNTDQIKDKARKDLLYLLEAVRGKKNLILERSLAGPIGTIVKVATLQEYGVDKFFFLENKNADTSQRNVIFIARGESALPTMRTREAFCKWQPRDLTLSRLGLVIRVPG